MHCLKIRHRYPNLSSRWRTRKSAGDEGGAVPQLHLLPEGLVHLGSCEGGGGSSTSGTILGIHCLEHRYIRLCVQQ